MVTASCIRYGRWQEGQAVGLLHAALHQQSSGSGGGRCVALTTRRAGFLFSGFSPLRVRQ
ncbi:MAG: hypothetical protein AVDCRST_MAG56-1841 [uncultured Cytophagales bacterium]|uniref:Uncharacterized protein n=1 Tax=uncultured Cytophagales bacterium TaxID=158755 RepID=A0A6J4IF49_9SPHI|nr:MAG: hypothetical protein AVDCRST_MAG56-1841 [uncultured Cytophagales bacterium]